MAVRKVRVYLNEIKFFFAQIYSQMLKSRLQITVLRFSGYTDLDTEICTDVCRNSLVLFT